MQRWTPGTKLLVWMIVVWTLIDIGLLAAAESRVRWSEFGLLTLVVAQFATLAGWLALGDGTVLTRAVCVALAIAIVELVAQVNSTARGEHQQVGLAAAYSAAYIVILSLPLFIAAALGWRCRQLDDVRATERPFQFRIVNVLVLMTALGALLGLWRVVPQEFVWLVWAGAATALMYFPLVTVQWILQLRPRPRLAAVVAVVVANGYCVAAVGFGGAEAPQLLTAMAISIAALAIHLALFRAWGYRLLRASEQRSGNDGV